jgi:sterol 3beta-glucosyltransferase
MNILIPTIGTRGDVQPFIALAQGLRASGHSTVLASHPVMRSLAESYNINFEPIGPDIDLGKEVAAIRQPSGNPWIGLMRGMRFAFEMLEKSHDDIRELCSKTDLVIVPVQSAAGKNEAEQLNLPYLSVTFMPWGIPYEDPHRSFIKRVAYKTLDSLIGLISTRPLNKIRKKQGLPPVGPEGFASPTLNLIPISPAVYAPNIRWDPHHHVVGYWFVDEPEGWSPNEELQAFLEDGESPLLISLGAMSLGEGAMSQTVDVFVKALQMTGLRAIVQGWKESTQNMSLPPTIYAAGSVPHSWLLPQCAGIIHHGGFGTTAAGLRAGIPALVIPHMVDQFYWGQRVHELGTGPKPIQKAKLEITTLAAAMQQLVQNDTLRSTTSALAEKIRQENGLNNAVQLIERTFS